ncbi:MAG: hypothetical protein LUG46_06505 [Erysipelotrichaceae bacterium]|nr:hypothetical protein [Erysipelotrichaceae bacterium]
MRDNYEKPMIMIEEYVLDTAIATGCETIMDLGPEDHEYNNTYYTQCSYWDTEEFDSEDPAYMSFFESCSCYLSAGDTPVFTS